MKYYFFIFLLILMGCNKQETTSSIAHILENSPNIKGKGIYLSSPMLTAGNRLYMVGHQDGSFPALGWHIKGEMGGIWNHPIKLMDGFDIQLIYDNDTLVLNKAKSFTNFPFANMHTFEWAEKDLEIQRWQFVPDDKEGMFIQLIIKNNGAEKKGKVEFIGHTDLRPTWLGERTQMENSKDQGKFDESRNVWVVKDDKNEWYNVFGSQLSFKSQSVPVSYPSKDHSISLGVQNVLFLFSNQTHIINYTIAGSYTSKDEALGTFSEIQKNWTTYLSEKIKRYEQLAQQSKLTTPDTLLNQTFEWLKYNSDWLVRTVPEIGTGIGAGIPDYPWWFGVDSEYALQGYMAIGQWEPAYQTVHLLDSVSQAANGNGRIIHEMSSNGAIFNPGNINETPQFATLIWKMYQWNGDKVFLQKYFSTIESGLEWLMKENDQDGNLFPDGFGMMEIHGMDSEMIDVAAYTQKAFHDAAKIASELQKDSLSLKYQSMAKQLKEKINTQFWSDKFNSYADFIGTDAQALQLIEDAIIRADTLQKPWAVSELKQTKEYIVNNPSSQPRPFVLHHNWVVNTPMEMDIAPKDKALKALTTAEKFTNPFGVFVTGIDRDETAGTNENSFQGSKVFSYTGAVMTLPTGVQTVAENNYGRPNKALDYLKGMSRSFSYALPGSMYEVSPDYGMMTQAWNIYGFAVPIVEQFFGVQPNAAHKTIVVRPQMPSEWDKASLEQVKVGDNKISIFYEKTSKKLSVKITQAQSDWKLKVLLKESKGNTIETTEASKTSINNGYHEILITQPSEKIILRNE